MRKKIQLPASSDDAKCDRQDDCGAENGQIPRRVKRSINECRDLIQGALQEIVNDVEREKSGEPGNRSRRGTSKTVL